MLKFWASIFFYDSVDLLEDGICVFDDATAEDICVINHDLQPKYLTYSEVIILFIAWWYYQ